MAKAGRLKHGVTFRGKVVVREKQGMCMNLALRSRDLYNLLVILFSFPAGSNVSHTPADRKCFVVYDSHGRYRFFLKIIYNSFLR